MRPTKCIAKCLAHNKHSKNDVNCFMMVNNKRQLLFLGLGTESLEAKVEK